MLQCDREGWETAKFLAALCHLFERNRFFKRQLLHKRLHFLQLSPCTAVVRLQLADAFQIGQRFFVVSQAVQPRVHSGSTVAAEAAPRARRNRTSEWSATLAAPKRRRKWRKRSQDSRRKCIHVYMYAHQSNPKQSPATVAKRRHTRRCHESQPNSNSGAHAPHTHTPKTTQYSAPNTQNHTKKNTSYDKIIKHTKK